MADALTRLVVDCSVVVKWKIPTEDHAAAAEALLGDWEHQVVDVWVPNHFPSEVISAFLRAARRSRLTTDEARRQYPLTHLPSRYGSRTLRRIFRGSEKPSDRRAYRLDRQLDGKRRASA